MLNAQEVSLIDPLKDIIKDVSSKLSIDELLLGAHIMTETRGNTWALRYEPKFSYSYMPQSYATKLHITFDTEINSQHTSWGCLQIMGCVAREVGFDDHLTKLVTPELGIYWGARKIQALIRKYPEPTDVISAYNAGSPKKDLKGNYINQAYVSEVLFWQKAIRDAATGI